MEGNMTQGSIPKHMIRFAVPMICGNVFQLTYNAVDSIIIGRYAGKEALAAIGTSNPIMNIVIFFIIGICLGASVLMSEFYGAGDMIKLKREISTTIIAGSIFTVVITIIGYIAVPFVLKLIHTPIDVIHLATRYLRIIFIGLIFTFFYNVYASTLRSIGDSKTPIYFLMISSVLNGGLDMVFIAGMKMGVTGAGLATILAESISCILCIVYVYQKIPFIQLMPKEFIFDKTLIRRTVSYSWATAMQQSVLQIGKVFIQGAVNPLGVEGIAAFNAVNRVDDFSFIPQQSIAQSMTVCIAQNRGAGKKERIKQAFRKSLLIVTSYWGLYATVVLICAERVMKLFVNDTSSQIVSLGSTYLRYMAFFYLFPAITNWIQGFFRGMGKMKVTFYATSIQMIFRVIFVYILIPRVGFSGIAFACAGGWIAMLLYELPVYYLYSKRIKKEDCY